MMINDTNSPGEVGRSATASRDAGTPRIRLCRVRGRSGGPRWGMSGGCLLGGSSHLEVGYNPSDLHGISRVNPLIIGVISHLLSGMSHQVGMD